MEDSVAISVERKLNLHIFYRVDYSIYIDKLNKEKIPTQKDEINIGKQFKMLQIHFDSIFNFEKNRIKVQFFIF